MTEPSGSLPCILAASRALALACRHMASSVPDSDPSSGCGPMSAHMLPKLTFTQSFMVYSRPGSADQWQPE